MILTNKQEEGLKCALERYKTGEKYTVIAGYAGTGKSTLIKFIIEAIGIDKDKVCYATFTGKAAEVLRKKGNRNAITLHRLLFEHIPKPNGRFYRKPKKFLDYEIVVVDEVSMAPKELMDELFKHRCHVICLGDPGQLPPVSKDEDNHLLDKPHIFLEEIMRQAKDSEIIRLSMAIRSGGKIGRYNGDNVRIVEKKDFEQGMLLWADQTICATNKTRNNLNKLNRILLNKGEEPEEGDKIICLRNYWDDISNNGEALVNGTIGYLKNPTNKIIELPPFLQRQTEIEKFSAINCGIDLGNNNIFNQIDIDKKMLYTGEKCCDWKVSYLLGKFRDKYGELVPKEFAYGYAITCWKAQGSEWDKVLIFEENFPFNKEEHQKFLYTAVTRSSQKLVLIKN